MNIDDIKVKRETRIVFMGTPDFAVPVLEGLIDNYNVVGIVSQPDKKVGRNGKIKETPIKEVAIKNNILIIQPNKITDAEEEIYAWKPDIIVTCAYGQILPVTLLHLPTIAAINVHGSILPKLRGGAPIHRAVMNGFETTGMTVMYMDKKMDAGDIISTKEIKIEEFDTAESMHDKLSILGRDLLLETLPSIINGTNNRIKQDENLVTYAPTIKREDEKINFSKSKKDVYNKVRGLNSWPGAYFTLNNKIIKVWEIGITNQFFDNCVDGQITNLYKEGIGVKVSNGEIVLKVIQPEGKGKMDAFAYVNGIKDKEKLIGVVLK